MKLLYCLLFCLVIFLPVSYSQNLDSNVVRIDAIPASGIALDKGWKFRPGDNQHGKIKVETKEGGESEFIIQLP